MIEKKIIDKRHQPEVLIQIHVKDFSSNQLRLFIVTQSAIYSSLQKYVE